MKKKIAFYRSARRFRRGAVVVHGASLGVVLLQRATARVAVPIGDGQQRGGGMKADATAAKLRAMQTFTWRFSQLRGDTQNFGDTQATNIFW